MSKGPGSKSPLIGTLDDAEPSNKTLLDRDIVGSTRYHRFKITYYEYCTTESLNININ